MADRATRRLENLKTISKAHDRTHANIHNDWKRELARVCIKNGINPSKLLSPGDYVDLPAEVHEELAEAKSNFIAGHSLSQEARRVSVRNNVSPRIR
jgi:hypothetical protein